MQPTRTLLSHSWRLFQRNCGRPLRVSPAADPRRGPAGRRSLQPTAFSPLSGAVAAAPNRDVAAATMAARAETTDAATHIFLPWDARLPAASYRAQQASWRTLDQCVSALTAMGAAELFSASRRILRGADIMDCIVDPAAALRDQRALRERRQAELGAAAGSATASLAEEGQHPSAAAATDANGAHSSDAATASAHTNATGSASSAAPKKGRKRRSRAGRETSASPTATSGPQRRTSGVTWI